MANITRFIPLEGVPDADARGMGTFLFDDGHQEILEDQEMADLVKMYQDELPKLEAQQLPDQRVASAGAYTPQELAALMPGEGTATDAPMQPPPGLGEFVAQADAPAAAPALPPPPTDAQKAAELHRIAGDQALRGKYVPGQAEGYTPASRTGALPEDLAKQQAAERQTGTQSVLTETELARRAEAENLRRSGLDEAMRLTVQKEDQNRQLREAEEKRRRLLAERRAVNDAQIDTSFAQGNTFAQVMAVMGSALLGAVGSDAGLRMIESNIDRHIRKEMQIRGSKLDALANELGDEELAISAAKGKIYALLEKEAANNQKFLDAAGIEHQTPLILAELKRRATDSEHEHVRGSLGKTVESYSPGRAAGYTGPDLGGAAKHFEQASKLSAPTEKSKAEQDKERNVSDLRRIRDTLKRSKASGALQSVTGWQDKLGANTVQDFFGGLPPDQREAATALDELQVGNLMRLVREPNNIKTQNMVQSIGVPKNDRDIDTAIQRLDQLIEIEERGDAPVPEPTRVR